MKKRYLRLMVIVALYALMGCVFFLLFARYYPLGIAAVFLILLVIDWVGAKKYAAQKRGFFVCFGR